MREPVVTEILPSPVSDKSSLHDNPVEVNAAAIQQSGLLSPVPSNANSLQIAKRQSSYSNLKAFGSIRASFGRFTNSFVREQHSVVRKKCQREFGAAIGDHVFNTSFEGLGESIKSERLMRLPRKGGSWDRVLIAAQHFAEQVYTLNRHIEMFTEESGAATNFVFGQCLLLLELGHENSSALEKAFNLFYQFGLELSPLLRRADLFAESQTIMEGLSRAFADLLQIVAGVSITFYQAVHNGRSSTKLDIFASFGAVIDAFRLRIHQCSHDMWSAALARHAIDGCQVDLLQKWLTPRDSVLAFLSSNHLGIACPPEQFTCKWIQPHLNAFLKSSEDILLIEGKAGSGKTVLANWVVDRLQRSRHVSTISFFFDPNIAAQSTSLSMLRTLLNQLLSRRIGDIDLFEAVNEAYTDSRGLSAKDQESKLWRALKKALNAVSKEGEDTLVIIIDGVGESNLEAYCSCQELFKLVGKYARVRLVLFSQPLKQKPNSSVSVKLSVDNVFEDIQCTVRRRLHAHEHFKERDVGDQESIIEKVAVAADGSMLWSYLASKLLQRQKSCKDFDDALRTLTAPSVTVPDVVQKLFVSSNLDEDGKNLLSLLVAAERPLQFAELDAMLNSDPKQLITIERAVGVQSMLRHISPFLIIAEGLVSIRHDAIRQAIHGLTVDAVFAQNLKLRHQDILTRILIATKAYLRTEHEPTLTCLDVSYAERRIQAQPLLAYTVCYWALHFKKSRFYKPTGDLTLPKEFTRIFSESVTFCLLEQACWNFQAASLQGAFELQNVAFRVRKALFGINHACVLQSALICATMCEEVLAHHAEAAEWYAMAARIGAVVIGAQADITIASCQMVLRITISLVTKKRTAIMNYREEVLLILVNSYKHRYGSSSKEVLEIYKKLQELYIHIEEETKVAEIVQIIQHLTVAIYGGHSEEAQSITRKAQVLLKGRERTQEIETFHGFLFHGYTEEKEESLTFMRAEIIMNLAASCISRGELVRAEELYIELWLKLSEHCHSVHVCEWHEKKIQVMLLYARFLHSQKRQSEASAILVAIWTEYEHHEFSMFESIVILLKEVAVCMRSVNLFTMALLVFQKCWYFLKHQHKEESTLYREVEEYISRTSIEIVETTETTTETSSETVIRTVYESSITSTEKLSVSTVKLCKSLVTMYSKEQRWSEAVVCIKKMLMKSWSSFFSESIENISLAESFSSESIELVISLAQSYVSLKKFEKAEEIYVRLYRAYRIHGKVGSAEVIRYSEMLLDFYASYEMFTKAISFYQELLVDYRAHFGASHSMTIKILYALGKLCRRHQTNYGYWLEYYLEIVVSLNKGAIICHEDAFEALVIVAEHYYETLRFSESLVYFKSIFGTFCKFGLKFKYFEKTTEVKVLIDHYFRSIEESKVEIHMHIAILKELREACFKYYGESSAITVNVTVTLAETCCRSEEHQFEAISFYELVMRHEASVSKEVIRRTETSLKTLYVKQVTSSTTKTVSKETTERATTLLYKRYSEIRKEYSCAHEVTLTHLKELVMLYHKQALTELAIKELKSLTVECVTKLSSAKELIEAATSIAAIYISCGFVVEGIELVRELKLQVIYKSTERCSHFGFNVTTIGRPCFAFIAAFEYHLRANYSISLTLYMSDLVAEYLFYERFVRHIKVKARLEEIFVCGARLRQILVRTHRAEDFAFIEHQVWQHFTSTQLTVVKSSSKESVRVFVGMVLEYFSTHSSWKSWTAVVGHAAVGRLTTLLTQRRYKEAYELTACTFNFLMAHEGLDDPTEIRLGFQLCLMMAARTDDKALNHKPSDPVLHKSMLSLSGKILAEVLDICKKFNFDLARCQLSELNSLIILIGEQRDFTRLQWLLDLLWSSREGQSAWSTETVLCLGRRLVQSQFAAGNHTGAIKLCENIVYNIRRVHGIRHYHTVSFQTLLASMYTSLALRYSREATREGAKNKRHSEEMARVYFKKAMQVHEEVLKQIVNSDDADMSDDDDDEFDYADAASTHRGPNGAANAGSVTACGFAWISREQELCAVREHIRKLQLAVQRYGGFSKPSSNYEKLTSHVWGCYGKEADFKMAQDQVLAAKWKVEGFGSGKAEGDISEDEFKAPGSWWILASEN